MSHLINYPHIASMVFNTPLYADPTLVRAIKAVLEPRLLGRMESAPTSLGLAQSQPAVEASNNQEDRYARSLTIAGKVAIISVHGVLVPRRGVLNNACQELISYEYLRGQITAALRHELVEHIAIDFHTGGGSAMGCKEMADFIRASTQIKPITAIINFAAYSAGYFLASACSKIICSPTGGVGSVGVIIETFEVSKWEEEVGIKYNTFYRGGHKNDCSPHEPITDQAVAEIDKRLDKAYAIFTGSVAEYRGLDVQAVIETEARLFDPEEALQLKLIDEIAPAQDAINAIAQRYKSTPTRSIRAQARAYDTACKI